MEKLQCSHLFDHFQVRGGDGDEFEGIVGGDGLLDAGWRMLDT